MKTLVVYDSVFGNTQKVAETVAQTLGPDAEAKRVMNTSLEDIQNAGLVIFGSPTRAFAPTTEMRGYLKNLSKGVLSGKTVGVFDTRMDVQKINIKILSFLAGVFGYAADTMVKLIARKGAVNIVSNWFFVLESEGPLAEGELERAAEWAGSLQTPE
ncbi:MAG: flavodoxin family protein [Spirochaetales bacterium]|nr:flavodoxin family protein [Spirochaetales bacterium]